MRLKDIELKYYKIRFLKRETDKFGRFHYSGRIYLKNTKGKRLNIKYGSKYFFMSAKNKDDLLKKLKTDGHII